MTPEERFDRIKHVLQATAPQQARQQDQLGAFGKEIEKQNDGIRNLIVVARTCLDSIKELRELQGRSRFSLVGSFWVRPF